jgi:hypothetical protein
MKVSLPCNVASLASDELLVGCVTNTKSNSAGAAKLTWKTARLGLGWLMFGSHSLMPESNLQQDSTCQHGSNMTRTHMVPRHPVCMGAKLQHEGRTGLAHHYM